jgi:molybdopterin/thiamine biosynthesis adenylyltransferase
MALPLPEMVREAAEMVQAPGHVDWRVISPVKVEEIARAHGRPRWAVEAAALEAGVVPLHYMRNIFRFAMNGQIDLLRSTVAVVGAGPAVEKCLERLAAHGLGRVRVLAPDGLPAPDAAEVARGVANVNASVETETGTLELRRGDPTEALRGVDVVAACLDDAADEFLLQTACRRLELPLVCAGLAGFQGQATTLLPGDGTLARVYRPDHPHLERVRPGASLGAGLGQERSSAGAMVGTWMADQVVAVRLQTDEVLRHRLLFADMQTGQIETFQLG